MGLAWLWEVKNYNTVIATLVAMHPLAGSQVGLDLKPLGVAGLVRQQQEPVLGGVVSMGEAAPGARTLHLAARQTAGARRDAEWRQARPQRQGARAPKAQGADTRGGVSRCAGGEE